MRRRSFLAAALAGATGLSGCSGLTGDGSNRDPYGVPATSTETPTPTSTPTTTTGDEDPPSKPRESLSSVLDLDVAPRTLALPSFLDLDRPGIRFDAGFTRTATAEHPATLTTVLANERDVPAVLNVFEVPTLREARGRRLPDWPRSDPRRDRYGIGGEDPPVLALVPTGNDGLADRTPEVVRGETFWRVPDGSRTVNFYPERIRLDPGERIVAEQAVVSGPETDGRPTGTYQFENGPDGVSIVVWNTERPGPTAESEFRGVDVEAPGDRSITWYHEAGPSTGAYLEPARETTELPARLPFRFVNRTSGEVSCGGWSLYKRSGGEWYLVGAGHDYFTSVCRLAPPGATVDWTLYAFDDEGLAFDTGGSGEVAHYLGGGRYAVSVGYGAGTDASAALFDVEADRTTVHPTDGVTIERDGSTAVVTSPAFEAEAVDGASVTATEVGDTRVTERQYVPEQVMQPRLVGLRNLLGPFRVEDGLERVRLRTSRLRVPEEGTVGLGRSAYEIEPVGRNDGQ